MITFFFSKKENKRYKLGGGTRLKPSIVIGAVQSSRLLSFYRVHKEVLYKKGLPNFVSNLGPRTGS